MPDRSVPALGFRGERTAGKSADAKPQCGGRRGTDVSTGIYESSRNGRRSARRSKSNCAALPNASSTNTDARSRERTYCNRILKRIAVEVGIDKAVTYHLRRHTFATTNALMQGIRIEVVNRCGFPAGLRRSLDGHSAGVSGKSGEKITCGAAFRGCVSGLW